MDKVEKYFLETKKITYKPFLSGWFLVSGKRSKTTVWPYIKIKRLGRASRAEQSVQLLLPVQWSTIAVKRSVLFRLYTTTIAELGKTPQGFTFELQDLEADKGHQALMAARNQLLAWQAQDSRLLGVRTQGCNVEGLR